MNKKAIYEYIKKIKKEDIYNYGTRQGIEIDNNDIDIIYNYINDRYDDIINNTDIILLEVKDKLSVRTYNKLLELFNKYKYIIKNIK